LKDVSTPISARAAAEYDEVARVWMESWGLDLALAEAPANSSLAKLARAESGRRSSVGWSLYPSPTTAELSPPCWRCICPHKYHDQLVCCARQYQGKARTAGSCSPFTRQRLPTKSGCAACAENEEAWRSGTT
jgi:hypothetical protein